MKRSGFTIVELLVVIVVIGILASITVVSYSGVTVRSQKAKVIADISQIKQAITMAREAESKVLGQITGNFASASSCVSKADGTDLATLSRSDSCWVNYKNALSKISTASGVNITNIVDPWGRPYFIDENEGEGGSSCNKDTIAMFRQPFLSGWVANPWTSGSDMPRGGYSGCPTP